MSLTRNSMHGASARAAAHTTQRVSAAGGFTLLEVLVAVGVLTFISVAIAAIFGSIGDTINAGKRVSELNRFATRIETVMAQDFEQMTRDGFLVIRHEYANGGTDIALSEEDANPRPRRVDQIMFFGRGDYTSARSDIYSGLTPRSNEARIWYGHGQRKSLADVDYLTPDLTDAMTEAGTRLGRPSSRAFPNPNEFAADWTLLRHVTLLQPPRPNLSQSLPDYSSGGLYGFAADRDAIAVPNGRGPEPAIERRVVADTAYQVALQPAITSIFWNAQDWTRSVSNVNPNDTGGNPPDPDAIYVAGQGPALIGYPLDQLTRARFSSGLIDIASTSLAEIESLVTSAPFKINENNLNINERRDLFFWMGRVVQQEALTLGVTTPSGDINRRYPFAVTSPLEQRQWMINALPTHPAEPRGGGGIGPRPGTSAGAEISDPEKARNDTPITSPRIRYEPVPPSFAASLTDAGGNQANSRARLQNAYRAADQEVLTRSIFIPRCSEFIVDWSFGEVFDNYQDGQQVFPNRRPDLERAALQQDRGDTGAGTFGANLGNNAQTRSQWKKLLWYGRDTWTYDVDGNQADLDGDGDIEYDKNDRVTRLFDRDPDRAADAVVEFTVTGGRTVLTGGVIERHNNNPDLRFGNRAFNRSELQRARAEALAKNPDYIMNTGVSILDEGDATERAIIKTSTFGYYYYDNNNTNAREDDTIVDWPWPKLIRVTFRLVDENDPTVETTYQTVFEVPGRDG